MVTDVQKILKRKILSWKKGFKDSNQLLSENLWKKITLGLKKIFMDSILMASTSRMSSTKLVISMLPNCTSALTKASRLLSSSKNYHTSACFRLSWWTFSDDSVSLWTDNLFSLNGIYCDAVLLCLQSDSRDYSFWQIELRDILDFKRFRWYIAGVELNWVLQVKQINENTFDNDALNINKRQPSIDFFTHFRLYLTYFFIEIVLLLLFCFPSPFIWL